MSVASLLQLFCQLSLFSIMFFSFSSVADEKLHDHWENTRVVPMLGMTQVKAKIIVEMASLTL